MRPSNSEQQAEQSQLDSTSDAEIIPPSLEQKSPLTSPLSPVPMVSAIKAEDLDEVQRLITADPQNLKIIDDHGNNIYMITALAGQLEIMDLLLTYVDPSDLLSQNNNQQTVFQLAASANRLEILKRLYKQLTQQPSREEIFKVCVCAVRISNKKMLLFLLGKIEKTLKLDIFQLCQSARPVQEEFFLWMLDKLLGCNFESMIEWWQNMITYWPFHDDGFSEKTAIFFQKRYKKHMSLKNSSDHAEIKAVDAVKEEPQEYYLAVIDCFIAGNHLSIAGDIFNTMVKKIQQDWIQIKPNNQHPTTVEFCRKLIATVDTSQFFYHRKIIWLFRYVKAFCPAALNAILREMLRAKDFTLLNGLIEQKVIEGSDVYKIVKDDNQMLIDVLRDCAYLDFTRSILNDAIADNNREMINIFHQHAFKAFSMKHGYLNILFAIRNGRLDLFNFFLSTFPQGKRIIVAYVALKYVIDALLSSSEQSAKLALDRRKYFSQLKHETYEVRSNPNSDSMNTLSPQRRIIEFAGDFFEEDDWESQWYDQSSKLQKKFKQVEQTDFLEALHKSLQHLYQIKLVSEHILKIKKDLVIMQKIKAHVISYLVHHGEDIFTAETTDQIRQVASEGKLIADDGLSSKVIYSYAFLGRYVKFKASFDEAINNNLVKEFIEKEKNTDRWFPNKKTREEIRAKLHAIDAYQQEPVTENLWMAVPAVIWLIERAVLADRSSRLPLSSEMKLIEGLLQKIKSDAYCFTDKRPVTSYVRKKYPEKKASPLGETETTTTEQKEEVETKHTLLTAPPVSACQEESIVVFGLFMRYLERTLSLYASDSPPPQQEIASLLTQYHDLISGREAAVKSLLISKATKKNWTKLHATFNDPAFLISAEGVPLLTKETSIDEQLILASKKGSVDVLRNLVEENKPVDSRLAPAFICALKQGHKHVIQYLSSYSSSIYLIRDEKGRSTFEVAALAGQLSVIQYLFLKKYQGKKQQFKVRCTGLALAYEHGHKKVVAWLAERLNQDQDQDLFSQRLIGQLPSEVADYKFWKRLSAVKQSFNPAIEQLDRSLSSYVKENGLPDKVAAVIKVLNVVAKQNKSSCAESINSSVVAVINQLNDALNQLGSYYAPEAYVLLRFSDMKELCNLVKTIQTSLAFLNKPKTRIGSAEHVADRSLDKEIIKLFRLINDGMAGLYNLVDMFPVSFVATPSAPQLAAAQSAEESAKLSKRKSMSTDDTDMTTESQLPSLPGPHPDLLEPGSDRSGTDITDIQDGTLLANDADLTDGPSPSELPEPSAPPIAAPNAASLGQAPHSPSAAMCGGIPNASKLEPLAPSIAAPNAASLGQAPHSPGAVMCGGILGASLPTPAANPVSTSSSVIDRSSQGESEPDALQGVTGVGEPSQSSDHSLGQIQGHLTQAQHHLDQVLQLLPTAQQQDQALVQEFSQKAIVAFISSMLASANQQDPAFATHLLRQVIGIAVDRLAQRDGQEGQAAVSPIASRSLANNAGITTFSASPASAVSSEGADQADQQIRSQHQAP